MTKTGQAGMEHWRRAVRWTGAGVFAVALVGGLTRGSLARADVGAGAGADAGGQPRPQASTTTSSAVSAKTAALGAAVLLRLSDLPSGWTSGNTSASPTP